MFDLSGLSYISEIMLSWYGEFSSKLIVLSMSKSNKSFLMSFSFVTSGGLGGGL